MDIELSDFLSTFDVVSYDKDNEVSMIVDRTIPVYNFDDLTMKYVSIRMHRSQIPPSDDALYIDANHFAFIEFKNGCVDNKQKNQISKKIYSSLLLLFDLAENVQKVRIDFIPNISYSRDNIDFILVYNEGKNSQETKAGGKSKGLKKTSETPQPSLKRMEIYQSIANNANQEIIRFGLSFYKGYVFKNVHTYTDKEFKMMFIDKIKAKD